MPWIRVSKGPEVTLLEVSGLETVFMTDRGPSRAVDGVSFSVGEGEIVGLVGESGCGKTVTALSLMGLVPEPGRIVLDSSIRFGGLELVGLTDRELRGLRGKDIAMIFQEPMTSLNPVLRVGEQVAEVLRLHRKMSRRTAANEAVRLLEEVGIPDPAKRAKAFPYEFSGGMRQRVMIAMALAGEPRLLIADEPTTALDVTVQAQILDLLGELRDTRNLSILFITHDLGVVAEICERVIVMYAGQVMEEGPVKRVLERPAHPYTRALLASSPRLDTRSRRLEAIPGEVPRPTSWPSGCRFQDRCSDAIERCSAAPPLFAFGENDRRVRCWLIEESETVRKEDLEVDS